jgi:hypothetical protein
MAPATYESPVSPYSFAAFAIVCLFWQPQQLLWHGFHCALSCIFLLTNELENLFMWLLNPSPGPNPWFHRSDPSTCPTHQIDSNGGAEKEMYSAALDTPQKEVKK